jgi:signal transduction histidine kinase
MTSPRNDSLQSLVSKISNHLLEILTDNQISFRSEIDVPDDAIVLNERIRNDTFLILKEALHNVIKHSHAKEVFFSAVVKDSECTIRMEDNGIGMDDVSFIMQNSHGNGLLNIHRRALDSGINLQINSSRNEGTHLIIIFRI